MRGIVLANNLAPNRKQTRIKGRGRGEEAEGKDLLDRVGYNHMCPLSANAAPGTEGDFAWYQDEDTSKADTIWQCHSQWHRGQPRQTHPTYWPY